MNELQRELFKVAGDLSQSEARVKEALKKRSVKKQRRFIPLFVSVGLVCVLAFLFFIQNEPEKQTAMLTHEEYSYYLHMESMWAGEINESTKKRALEKMLIRIGRIEYGKSIGLHVSEEEIDERIERDKVFLDSPEYKAMLEQMLNEANISQTYYDSILNRQHVTATLVGDLIIADVKQTYTHINESIATMLTNKMAVTYMEEHFAEEIDLFRVQYQIEPTYQSYVSVVGVVALVEGNMFYLIEDPTYPDTAGLTHEEIYQKYTEVGDSGWYPNVDGLEVEVGDVLSVPSGASSSEAEDGYRVGFNHGNVEIVQHASSRQEKINLTGTAAQTFANVVKEIEWQTNVDVNMLRMPDYIVTVNGNTYSIWAKYYNSGLEMIHHETNAYVKLINSSATPIFDVLQ